jgi:hypothetical protein
MLTESHAVSGHLKTACGHVDILLKYTAFLVKIAKASVMRHLIKPLF